jgi:NAD(P)-dependent dehydrogenase (short-subunit alcohol dehydrogenase family)
MPGAVIVTGASRGIGAATARLLSARGRPILVNYAHDPARADEVVTSIRLAGGVALAVRADVSQEDDVVAMFDAAAREFGTVSGLVNNAAVVAGFGRLEDVSAAAVKEVLATNVLGAILCIREAVRRMSTRHGGAGGAIVNVGSLAARTGSANEWVHYAASKGAVREVAADGIRVNCVSPGLIETELHARSGQPDRLERLRPGIPMQRPGTADEVASAIAWLLSDESSYVTGAILEIGGGR